MCKPFSYHMTSLTTAAFCSANLVSDVKNSRFSSIILPLLLNFLQISAHSKSDTDEVAL